MPLGCLCARAAGPVTRRAMSHRLKSTVPNLVLRVELGIVFLHHLLDRLPATRGQFSPLLVATRRACVCASTWPADVIQAQAHARIHAIANHGCTH